MNRKSEEDGFCSIDGTFLNLRKGNTIIRLLLGYVPVNNVYSEEDGGFMLSCHNEGFSILRKNNTYSSHLIQPRLHRISC